ncbi:MAG: serine/threonine-protein kinase, partial [Candidatus Zixiibacteriota bacterium]
MSTTPQVKGFKLLELLSENNLTQSWSARHLKTERSVFLKLPCPDPSIGINAAQNLLNRSYELQKRIHCSRILTAAARHSTDSVSAFEYPLVDPDAWQTLTPELFWKHLPEVLVDLCVLTDYLHLLDLVHADLKLSNFLIAARHGRVRTKLVDLDFLADANSSPAARLLGTPGHIAPEILNNETVSIESDNYSLGVSLTLVLDSGCAPAVPDSRVPSEVIPKLKALTDNLTKPDRIQRPRYLVDALHRHDIINSSRLQAARKKLLAMWLTTFLNKTDIRLPLSHQRFRSISAKDLKVLGLPDDLSCDLATALSKRFKRALLSFRTLIRGSEVGLVGEFWRLKTPDYVCAELLASTDKLLRPGGRQVFARAYENRDTAELAAAARKLKNTANYLKAYLCLQKALQLREQESRRDSDLQEENLLLEAAGLA